MKKIVIILLLSAGLSLSSYDLGLKAYGFNLTLVETGEYKKDNLYTFQGIILGPAYYYDIGNFQLYNFLGYQHPNKIVFEDALGEDPNNYIWNKFYWGVKNNLGVAYDLSFKHFKVRPALFFNFDYIYMKGLESKEEFIFSYIGNGLSLDLAYVYNSKVSIGATGGFAYNYLDLSGRDTELIYSYSWYIGGLLELRL